MDYNTVKLLMGDVDDTVFVYGVIGAVVVVLLTIIVIYAFRRRSSLRNAILITGLSESGKTLLFSRLVSTENVTTYTSMKENVATLITTNQKIIKLVDIPGNERIRSKFLDVHLPSSRGIIFVVDSMNFSKEIRDVADFLYTLIQERFIQKNNIPLLVLCNKQDHAVAKSAKVIQSQLEKEMNAVRVTQTAKLDSTSHNEENVFLGQKGKDFQFADLKPLKVEFSECSALETGEGSPTTILPQIWTWMSKVA